MKKTIKVITLTLLSLGLLIGGVICILFLIFSPDKFNQDRWLKKPEERVDMVDSLLSEVNLKGKTKAEIIELLGEQEKDVYFKEPNNLVYYLGAERGFISIDSEWLVIWFDDKGKMTNYEVKTD
ncbi:hypothetical protein LC048_24780 [Mesobacillus subterraneus]|uniref:hypothetical protein n=1 Tax=Mesobacillus subterraneus TaxID=285983 RepID=UPI001CFEF518|nr:hypothetical protein [Mesobacillus subterraneus]WLR55434.1 hypothetical protein LC048_24780 [Mesobacillus subterraneus]